MAENGKPPVIVVADEQVLGARRLLFCGNGNVCRRRPGKCYNQPRLLASTPATAWFPPDFSCFCPRCGAFNCVDLERVAELVQARAVVQGLDE